MSLVRVALIVSVFGLGCASSQPTSENPEPQLAPAKADPRLAEVRKHMWTMASLIRMLDENLQGARKQEEVVDYLEQIKDVASQIQDVGFAMEHPLLTTKIPHFLGEIEHARVMATGEPPDFVYAGTAVGACVACHDLRVCPFDAYSQCMDAPIY